MLVVAVFGGRRARIPCLPPTKDLYKYDAGNGYPCFDVLYECSVGNATKGTKDVEGESIKRENGMTESTWSRKLETSDPKDWPISRGNNTVLLAHGTEDYFTYHAQHHATCQAPRAHVCGGV